MVETINIYLLKISEVCNNFPNLSPPYYLHLNLCTQFSSRKFNMLYMLWNWYSFHFAFFSLFHDQRTITDLKIRVLPTFPSIFIFIFEVASVDEYIVHLELTVMYDLHGSPLSFQIACLLGIKNLFLFIYHVEKNNLNWIFKYCGKIKLKRFIPTANLLYKGWIN